MPPDLPRFIPTLTEVVASGTPVDPPPLSVRTAAPPATAAPRPDEDARLHDDLAEQIAHRVLQRVDAALEARLSATIRAVVERHTEAMLPTLREEIVAAVQHAVTKALAEEFAVPEASVRR